MTGTAVDGMIDIAAIRTDGERIDAFGPWTLAPYPDATRRLLAETLRAPPRRGSSPAPNPRCSVRRRMR